MKDYNKKSIHYCVLYGFRAGRTTTEAYLAPFQSINDLAQKFNVSCSNVHVHLKRIGEIYKEEIWNSRFMTEHSVPPSIAVRNVNLSFLYYIITNDESAITKNHDSIESHCSVSGEILKVSSITSFRDVEETSLNTFIASDFIG